MYREDVNTWNVALENGSMYREDVNTWNVALENGSDLQPDKPCCFITLVSEVTQVFRVGIYQLIWRLFQDYHVM